MLSNKELTLRILSAFEDADFTDTIVIVPTWHPAHTPCDVGAYRDCVSGEYSIRVYKGLNAYLARGNL